MTIHLDEFQKSLVIYKNVRHIAIYGDMGILFI